MIALSTLVFFAMVLFLSCEIARRVGKRQGYVDAYNKAAREHLEVRIKHARSGHSELRLRDFEDHCHLTVTNNLPGTPDWWSHICFKKAGECGEFMEHVGKASRDDGWKILDGVDTLSPERREALIKEIGDGWWYDVEILRELGSSAQECMMTNIAKRESRMERGTIKGAGDNR